MIMLMQLLYEFGNEKKSFMAIFLGERNNKIVCLLDTSVSQGDANKLRNAAELLGGFTIDARIKWVRENLPDSYKGYREIFNTRVTILRQFPLKKI